MSILRAFSNGIRRATTEPRMVLALYIVNLLMALPVALAFRDAMVAGFGASMAPAGLMGGLDFTVLSDFMNFHAAELSAVFRQITWAIVVYMLVNSFLAGGVLTILRKEYGGYSTSEFFEGCGTYFGRFLRLFVVCAIVLLLLVLIMTLFLAMLSSVFIEDSASEVTTVVFTMVQIVLFFLPVVLLLMIADYTKISIVVNNERRVLKTAWRSMKFVFSHLFKTFGLELLMLLVPVVLFAIYALLDLAIGMTTNLTIVVMLVIQQLFIASRAWTKVLFFEGERSMFESLQPVVYANIEGAGNPLAAEPVKP
ncbi:MAG: hypothetical protein NTU47_07820 [Ignavibacteriales bacterium]|nr:hypothetical protein [Ignavibacteriales bacterium]